MKNTIFNAAYQAPRLGYVEHTYERHDACSDDIRHTEWQQQHSDDGSRQLPDDEVQVDVANPVGVHLGNEASFSHSACVLPLVDSAPTGCLLKQTVSTQPHDRESSLPFAGFGRLTEDNTNRIKMRWCDHLILLYQCCKPLNDPPASLGFLWNMNLILHPALETPINRCTFVYKTEEAMGEPKVLIHPL